MIHCFVFEELTRRKKVCMESNFMKIGYTVMIIIWLSYYFLAQPSLDFPSRNLWKIDGERHGRAGPARMKLYDNLWNFMKIIILTMNEILWHTTVSLPIFVDSGLQEAASAFGTSPLRPCPSRWPCPSPATSGLRCRLLDRSRRRFVDSDDSPSSRNSL